jgi:hypothetical protein
MRKTLTSIVLVMVLTFSGCLVVPVTGKSNRGHGPPPHAPAHGYRHHYQGATLTFDSKLGVYLVLDHRDCFYFDGRFLRVHESSWQVSASLSGPWTPYPSASLPPGLRKLHPSKGKGHKAKGHGPKKGRW